MVTPVFHEVQNGKGKVVGLMAKRARGMMARFIMDKRVKTPQGLKSFDKGGYAYNPELSNDNTMVFQRAKV